MYYTTKGFYFQTDLRRIRRLLMRITTTLLMLQKILLGQILVVSFSFPKGSLLFVFGFSFLPIHTHTDTQIDRRKLLICMNAWREIERKTKILGTCQDAESGSSWLVPENPVLNPPFAHTYTYRRTHNHETNTIYRFIQLDTCYTIDNMYTYIHFIF